MKAWGQWVEGKNIYGVRFRNNFQYNFNHWSKNEWHGPQESLLTHYKMKFYIKFQYE